jgi:hypothetical protein
MNNNFRGVCHNLTKYVSNIIVQKMQVASQVLDVNNNLMMIYDDVAKTKQ